MEFWLAGSKRIQHFFENFPSGEPNDTDNLTSKKNPNGRDSEANRSRIHEI
jgi:hypothetical protein